MRTKESMPSEVEEKAGDAHDDEHGSQSGQGSADSEENAASEDEDEEQASEADEDEEEEDEGRDDDDKEWGTFDLVANADVTKTGISFKTLPPGEVVVFKVAPGSWAEDEGVQPGDAFVKINGREIATMTADEFTEAMQRRPLRLRPAQEKAADDAEQLSGTESSASGTSGSRSGSTNASKADAAGADSKDEEHAEASDGAESDVKEDEDEEEEEEESEEESEAESQRVEDDAEDVEQAGEAMMSPSLAALQSRPIDDLVRDFRGLQGGAATGRGGGPPRRCRWPAASARGQARIWQTRMLTSRKKMLAQQSLICRQA